MLCKLVDHLKLRIPKGGTPYPFLVLADGEHIKINKPQRPKILRIFIESWFETCPYDHGIDWLLEKYYFFSTSVYEREVELRRSALNNPRKNQHKQLKEQIINVDSKLNLISIIKITVVDICFQQFCQPIRVVRSDIEIRDSSWNQTTISFRQCYFTDTRLIFFLKHLP